MKKLIMIGLLLCLMSGCGKDYGTFEQGDKELSRVFSDINEQIDKGSFSIPLLNDRALSDREVETLYHLDMTKIADCMVKTAAIQAQLGEIAIFKVEKKNESYVKKAIESRKEALKKQWGSYVEEADSLLYQAKEGRIGQYYYFVLGSDSEKVVNYMQKIDA
ncbi:DUF4358 domain-containing protein [[Clostridium] innocuum]|nr:DUF4358 domain-containing protein [[Clostridium] innocuum]